ncbi:predicted protein [Uncinocarpus reesii 1704]|uniref:Uncharacterized protein n=1 Tax=Uncinocarpus reesii (strain UAMH 1704) TaxID=336963 RepID=C4JIK5_UNCRE|nr:uncharacterized protein UREG_01542 [Uncinocarpus reesii 1704]EEP76693.1 predicted protein [Uncinocarpus reesii 1704]
MATKPFLGLPDSLRSLVSARFAAARQSGALLFTETELATIRLSNIPFQLRFCRALAKKPTRSAAPSPKVDGAASRTDPFANPLSDLLIAEIPPSQPSHILVLNKFPIIPNHFILATKDFQPQDHLLDKEDLGIAFDCLRSWEDSPEQPARRRLFAFFNSGEHSGASQPHRHIQFIPVEDMSPLDGDLGWTPLVDRMAHAFKGTNIDRPVLLPLPFACYGLPLAPNPSADDLHRAYISLYTYATHAAQKSQSEPFNNEQPAVLQARGPSVISYNLAMTATAMVLCPRLSEHARIPLHPELEASVLEEGLVKPNGTILAGTLLVKTESEWNALRDDPALLHRILTTIAVPRNEVQFPAAM